MQVATLRCDYCDDEWTVPDPGEIRESCRECGDRLEVDLTEVA